MMAASDGKLEATKTWGASPTGTTWADGLTPGSKEFFETVTSLRDEHELPWLADVVPFKDMANQSVLEIGSGPGYDAIKFLDAGTHYTGVDLTPENIYRAKAHLAHYGYFPDMFEGDAEQLPFSDASFDVVFSNGVLHHVPNFGRALSEACRVLKPGGSGYIIVYHKHSAFYLVSVVLMHLLLLRFFTETLAARRSRIEFTTGDGSPIVNVYGRDELGRYLRAAGFDVERLVVRKFVPDDLPGGPLRRLWRMIPQRIYDTMSPVLGWYLTAIVRRPKT